MKATFSTMYGLLLSAFIGSSSFAAEAVAPVSVSPPKELRSQTVCPVMGKPIDSTSFTDIQGQRVYLCCAGCTKKLLADPQKYFKQAATEGILFHNTQKTCPVSGEALEKKDIYSDYEGRRIYFCCKKCQGKFGENPYEYLKKLDTPAATDKPASESRGDENRVDHDHH